MLGAIAAGALAGLAGIPHCAGMCGPLAVFSCSRGSARQAPLELLRYQAGRSSSYALLGALSGGLGSALAQVVSGGWASAALSWVLALALALAALRLWRSAVPVAPATEPRPVELGRSARPPSLVARLVALAPRDPLLLGFVSALLPCGMLASALLVAAATGSAATGALTMLAFSLASGLALAGAVLLAGRARLAGHRGVARALAVVLALGAIALVVRPIPALLERPAVCHTPSG